MCVAITLEPGTFLDEKEVAAMNRQNSDGVGIAWARGGIVEWYKTIKVDVKYITDSIYAAREFPRLVHFRYATAGGTMPVLCHPFEIGPVANWAPKGAGTRVMMHTGHWGKWSEVRDIYKREGLLPDGPWSDSRLAALLAYDDPDWLNALGGRVATMNGKGEIIRIGPWEELRPGVMVSNKQWENCTISRGQGTGFRHWKGWGATEEEIEAFFRQKELEEENAAKEALAEMDAAIDAEFSKLSRKEKRAKRKEERAKRKNSGETGEDNGTTSTSKPITAGPGKFQFHTGTGLTETEASPILGGEPVQASNGRWYRAVLLGGKTTVVEVFPPGPKGGAGEGAAC